jgi:hypothetical protein
LRSTTFVVELNLKNTRATIGARFCMIVREPESGSDPAPGHDPEFSRKDRARTYGVQQQSGGWAKRAGARATEGMDAIQSMKTMAGSPDAGLIRSASRNLAHGFFVLEASSLS